MQIMLDMRERWEIGSGNAMKIKSLMEFLIEDFKGGAHVPFVQFFIKNILENKYCFNLSRL